MDRPAKRKTIRLPHYDYRSTGVYHVTICSKNRAWLFGRIEDGRMFLNELGVLVEQKIEEVPEHYPEADVIASVVMPNHVHMLVGRGTNVLHERADAMRGETDAIHGVPTGKSQRWSIWVREADAIHGVPTEESQRLSVWERTPYMASLRRKTSVCPSGRRTPYMASLRGENHGLSAWVRGRGRHSWRPYGCGLKQAIWWPGAISVSWGCS